MTDSQNTKNEQQKDLCITSEQLTEQWKKGELPEGFYWVKVKEEIANYPILADCVRSYEYYEEYTYFPEYEDSITSVLAPVPTYEEFQDMEKVVHQAMAANIKLVDKNKRLKHDVGNFGYKIKNQRKEIERQIAQNAELKELLIKCRVKFETYAEEDETCGLEEENKYAKIMISEINEVLK